MREWIRRGDRPLVYSTRFGNKYNHEEEWLRGHELWEHVDFLQREEGRIAGPSLVAQWAQVFQPGILIDDRPEVRDACRGLVRGLVCMSHRDLDPPPEAA